MSILTSSTFWVITFLLLVILDLAVLNTMYLLIIGFGAGFAFIAALLTDNALFIIPVFVVGSFLSYYLVGPMFKEKFNKKTLNESNVYSLIDKEAVVSRPISVSEKGYVTVNSAEWLASSSVNLNIGDIVIIKKIEGTTLFVEKKFIEI